MMKLRSLLPLFAGLATACLALPAACADTPSDAELTAKRLALLNAPAGKDDLTAQLKALLTALDAGGGKTDLAELPTKLQPEVQAANAAPAATPPNAAVPATPVAKVPSKNESGKGAPAAGLKAAQLQPGSLTGSEGVQSSSQGLTPAEEWRRLFAK